MVDTRSMSRVEWCECICDNTFMGLSPVGLDGTQAWVHAKCGKPTFLYWQVHEKYCDECGRSFSSFWSDICEHCAPKETLVTWFHALQLTALVRPFSSAVALVEKLVA